MAGWEGSCPRVTMMGIGCRSRLDGTPAMQACCADLAHVRMDCVSDFDRDMVSEAALGPPHSSNLPGVSSKQTSIRLNSPQASSDLASQCFVSEPHPSTLLSCAFLFCAPPLLLLPSFSRRIEEEKVNFTQIDPDDARYCPTHPDLYLKCIPYLGTYSMTLICLPSSPAEAMSTPRPPPPIEYETCRECLFFF